MIAKKIKTMLDFMMENNAETLLKYILSAYHHHIKIGFVSLI